MSEMEHASTVWDCRGVAERLGESLHRVVRVRGAGPSALQECIGALREHLAEQDIALLSLDPTGASEGAPDLRSLTVEYVRRAEPSSERNRAVRRQLDIVTDLRRQREGAETGVGREQFEGAFCALWKNLAQIQPAVILVLHPDALSEHGSDLLRMLVRTQLKETVESLVPELEGEVDGTSGLSVVFPDTEAADDYIEEGVQTSTVNLVDQARESIRQKLAADGVVDQFLATTGGNPARVSDLVEALPDDAESLWHFRYRNLAPADRDVVDLLAVAGEAVPLSSLRRFFETWRGDRLGEDRIRRLCEEEYLRREIDETTLRVGLTDVAFERSLRENVGSERRQSIHEAIAEAIEASRPHLLSDRFVARHSLAAGRFEQGFQFGVRAAEELYARHALEEARSLFERLLDCARESGVGSDEQRNDIYSYLVDLLGDLGEPARGIEYAETLEERLESGPFRWRIELERARLHVRIGEHTEAEQALEKLQERFDADEETGFWAATVERRADAHYAQGHEERAERLATMVVEALEGRDGDRSRRAEEALVQARNTVGRIALYRGEHDRARELFVRNGRLAREWSWRREVHRAETNLAVLDLQSGAFAEAVESLEGLLESSPAPTSGRRAYLLVNLGMARQRLGAYGEALEAYREVFQSAENADEDVVTGIAAYNLATLCQDFGAYERVLELADWLQERKFDAERHQFVGTLPELLRANALMARDEYEAALQEYDAVALEERSPADLLPAGKLQLRKAVACVRTGRRARAQQIVEELEASERARAEGALASWFELVYALLAEDAGDWSRASALAASAEQSLRESGNYGDAIRASIVRIRALAREGRAGEAEELIEQRLRAVQERADAIPAEFRTQFFDVPSYRRLVKLSRDLTGGLPEGVYGPDAESETAEVGAPTVPEYDDAARRRLQRRYPEIVGRDDRLMEILSRIDRVASSDAPILVQGESGSGKELVARAIHRESARSGGPPFVKVNCGAFVDNLLLSELFGHEEGAFTGAVERKHGCFERADGGTIFLDEIGEISAKAQVALLRVLQEGEFERVGGSETLSTDVRLVCATNRDLESMVESGAFRLDLYYRLKGVVLELPPLRERRRDLPLLVRHFADRASPGEHVDFSKPVLEFLASYRWPGNVRELRNFVESVLLFVEGDRVEMRHLREFRDFFPDDEIDAPAVDVEVEALPEQVSPPSSEVPPEGTRRDPEAALVEEVVGDGRDLKELQAAIQHEAIRRALEATDGNITKAAELLEISRPRLSQIVNGDDELLELKEQLVA